MTKEELEKEAEEKYREVDREFMDCQDEGEVFNIGYVLGAEPREKRIAELEKEIAELKKEWQEQVQKATDEGYARTLQTIQLTKAKDIIKFAIKGIKKIACEERCDFVNKEFFCDDCAYGKWIAKAEQFLKE